MVIVTPTRRVTLTTQAIVTPEGLVLPPGIIEKLALQPGSHVSVTVHPSQPAPAPGRAEELVQNLRTMLGDGPSLEDEYFRSKDKDKW